ncbi:MAG: right-handed parallel beta-helix repeat-containing protein, partial [Acidobacteriota bacterium]
MSTFFAGDIDGQPRPQGAAWDVGADESFLSAVATYYRSIGTAPDVVNSGTITVTAGSATVTKVGGVGWQAQNRGRGDVLIVNGTDQYMILGVTSNDALTLASLPTTGYVGTTYTIARQFTNLADWENCIDGPVNGDSCTWFSPASSSLVADDRSEVGIAYKDSVLTLSSSVAIDDSTTDATHTITLTADGTNRHYGAVGAGVIVDAALDSNEIQVYTPNVTIEWLELRGLRGPGSSRGAIRVLDPAANILLQNLLIHDFYDPDGSLTCPTSCDLSGIRLSGNPGKSVTVRNTMVWDGDHNGIEADEVGDAVTIENCTIDNIRDTSSSRGIYAGNTLDVIVRNTIATRNGADFSPGAGSFAALSNYNVDSDGSAPGVNSQTVDPLLIANFYVTPGSNLHLLATATEAIDTGLDPSSGFINDIDGEIRPGGASWDIGADEFGATTVVELVSFEAVGVDSAVDLSWRTGSELNNLGFHLHRSLSEGGPWTRITSSLIPGLGSSPEGASYSFRDTGLVNGVRYFYRLEDIDAHSGSTFHGPVSAVPEEAPPADEDDDSSDPESEESPHETRTYGHPEATSFEIVSRTRNGVVVELRTPGFLATLAPEGVHVSVPGFDQPTDPHAADLPLKRVVLDALVGRHARMVWVKERQTRSYPGLTPAAVGAAEIITAPDGTVRPGRRAAAVKGEGLLPPYAAAIAGDAFIGEAKKIALEMSPLRYDASTDTLLLTQTLRVKIAFDRKAAREETGRGSRGRRRPRSVEDGASEVLAHLHTRTRGLHAVSFETLFPRGHEAVPLDLLRLSRQGEGVAFHVEPKGKSFGPGSVLYFWASTEAASTDYSPEVAYALEQAPGGVAMPLLSASPRGSRALVSASLAEESFEINRHYQSGLLDAPDIWLWDFMLGGMSKSFPLTLEGVDPTSALSVQLQVFLQGASEADTEGEHHLSLSLNGTPIGETSFDGKLPHVFSTSVPASVLVEGENSLTVTNLGDTGAYSFVFLDRVDLVYPRTPALQAGRFSGVFSEAGQAVVSGEAQVGLDVTDPQAPVW